MKNKRVYVTLSRPSVSTMSSPKEDRVPEPHQEAVSDNILQDFQAVSEQPVSEPLTYFEKQRDLLVSDIRNSMELILNEMNSLNKSLEISVAVGKEFDRVSALWDSFYQSDLYSSNTEQPTKRSELASDELTKDSDPKTPR